jgi:hypothetical protein
MKAIHSTLSLGALALLASSTLANETKLVASDGASFDTFGWSVDVDGQNVVSGAPAATEGGVQTGKAYVYDVATGTEQLKLVPANGSDFDSFGWAVAADGARVLVASLYADGGGPNHGAVYVYDSTTGQELMQLVASDGAPIDEFGQAIDVDGNLVVVGAMSDDDNGDASGSAYVFDLNTGAQVVKLLPTDGAAFDFFGIAVAISGNYVLVGAFADDDNGVESGSAYVFDATTGAQLAKLLPDDGIGDALFGSAVALEGSTALVGARHDPEIDHEAGAAYLFDLAHGVQTAKLLANDGAILHRFGTSVALDGTIAIVGAPGHDIGGTGSGAAYHFNLTTDLQTLIVSSDLEALDNFGHSVANASNTIAVGAFAEDSVVAEAGAAYLFDFGPTPVVNYCTAGTSASGCQATLSGTGTASATAPSGFTINASSVEGSQNGSFFYGTNGRQAIPWGNGTSFQCVVPPVQRAGTLDGTGRPGQCDGSFAQDLNAFWTAQPAKNPGAGALVQAQLWYRDPENTSNQSTSRSDAVEFPVCP